MNSNTIRRRRTTTQIRNRHIRQQRKRWESIKHKETHTNNQTNPPQNF